MASQMTIRFELFVADRDKSVDFYTSVLGGLASTTAATLLFARESKERPQDTFGLWRAFVIANTVQFPRTFLIVMAVSPELARVCVWPLAAMLVTGVVLAEILQRWPHNRLEAVQMTSGNPFRILPALRFGALFAAVVFFSKAAAATLGTGAFYWTSLLGGLVAPSLWSGLLYTILGLLNPLLAAHIDWLWFIASQVAFGIVAGLVVVRQSSVPTYENIAFALRAGIEAPGITRPREQEEQRP